MKEIVYPLTFLALSSSLNPCLAKENNKPNILIIMADDMGYSDIGCYGGEVETPNIDKLAYQGVRFTQFYNSARCCPTRASLLTGLHPHQAGVGHMVQIDQAKYLQQVGMEQKAAVEEADATEGAYQGFLNKQCVTIAEVLGAAGYNTLMSGKWHVGEYRPVWPCDRGFDRYWGLISGAANYYDITKGKGPGVVRFMANDNEPFYPPKTGFYMTDAITDSAVSMLNQYAGKENPFFMYLAYTAPHWPLHAFQDDIEKYRGKFMKGWDKLREERFARMKKLGIVPNDAVLSPSEGDIVDWDSVENKEAMDLKMAVYAAQITSMDRGIGKVLDKLEEKGQLNNTLIIFLSDNGGCAEGGIWGFDNFKNGLPPGGVDSYMSYGESWANLSNTPFRLYKHYVHEGGISTPLIVHWPAKVKDPGIRAQMGHLTDLMATCVDVAGASYPETYKGNQILPSEGRSLMPAILEDKPLHDTLCWEHEGNCAVRAGNWKLVARNKLTKDHRVNSGVSWELYDLNTDRSELNDLSGRYPSKVSELSDVWTKWAERTGALQ
jgi:arylsulfatase